MHGAFVFQFKKLRSRVYRSVGLLLLAIGGAAGVSAETLRLGTFPIPLMVESAERGLFIDMIRELERRTIYDFSIEVFPTRRAAHTFSIGAVDGLFPALSVLMKVPYHRTRAFYFKKDFAFVNRGQEVPSQSSDLSAFTVGFTQGYPYSPEVMAAAGHISMASSDVANMRKLASRRVDVVVAEKDSGLQAVRDSGVDNVVFDERSVLSQLNVFIAFQATTKGCLHAQAISVALDEMRLDGTLADIFNLSESDVDSAAIAADIEHSNGGCESE